MLINPFFGSGFSNSASLLSTPPNGPLRNTNNNVTLNTAAGDLLQIVCAKNACQTTLK